MGLVVLSFILLLNPLPMAYDRPFLGLPHRIQLVGIGLMLMGMLLGTWGRQVLADNWSGAIQQVENQTLVTRGPCRYIRNPMYTGFLLAAFGTTLYQPSPSSLLGLLILCGTYAVKISREERFLRQVLPGYVTYCEHTRRLIPFLY